MPCLDVILASSRVHTSSFLHQHSYKSQHSKGNFGTRIQLSRSDRMPRRPNCISFFSTFSSLRSSCRFLLHPALQVFDEIHTAHGHCFMQISAFPGAMLVMVLLFRAVVSAPLRGKAVVETILPVRASLEADINYG